MKRLTYAAAGVDVVSADRAIKRVLRLARSTFTRDVAQDIGHFGGMVSLRCLPRDPVMVISTDGVGTKTLIAERMRKYDTVGRDLVNHCVNDVAVCGAVPIAFVDYVARGKIESGFVEEIVKGVARGCRENGVALVGGETAEMPAVYPPGSFDLAGTIVGVAGRKDILGAHRVRAGDVIVGLPSSGLHTNGYSLARAAFFKRREYDPHVRLPGLRLTLGEELLRVHRSYLRAIRVAMKTGALHAAAHVTGGGIAGNLVRVLPRGRRAEVDHSTWRVPAIFKRLQEAGRVADAEMFRATNMGVGLVLVVSRAGVGRAMKALAKLGERAFIAGYVVRGRREVVIG